MGDADDSLDVLIRVKSDVADAGRATEALNRTTDATKGASEATGKHTVGLHAMHRIFHSLNEVVPGLGVAMQAVFSPIGATISLAVMALRIFQEHLKKVNEELDKMAEENAKPLTNRLEAQRESVVKNAAGMAELAARAAEAARAEESVAAATERSVKTMRDKVAGEQGTQDARKEGELTMLETLHGALLVSEEQFAEMKLAVEAKYLKKKQELEERAEMTEILIKRRAAEQAALELPALDAARKTALGNSVKAHEDLNSLNEEGINEARKTAHDNLKAWEKESFLVPLAYGGKMTKAKVEDVLKGMDGKTDKERGDALMLKGVPAALVPELLQQYGDLTGLRDKADKTWKDLPKNKAELQVATDESDRQAALASKRYDDRARFITEEGRDEADRRERLKARQDANREAAAAQAEAGKLGTPFGVMATQDLGRAEVTASRMETGKPVNPMAVEGMREAASAIAGHQVTVQESLAILREARQNTAVFTQDVLEIVRTMTAMAADRNAMKTEMAQLRAQVNSAMFYYGGQQ